MIHVMILEDDKVSAQALEAIIKEHSGRFCVHTASTKEEAEKLLDTEAPYEVFFLDVNLSGTEREDIGGIQFARKIREQFRYSFTPIVMVTSIGAMEMQAYRELHCYQYLMKPYDQKQVEEVLDKVLEKESSKPPETVLIKKDGINYQVRCDDILYISAIRRGICMHMKDQILEVPYVSLKQIAGKLPQETFWQCHRMFLINAEEVEYYDLVNRVVKLKGSEDLIEIGVTYKTEIGRRIHARMG